MTITTRRHSSLRTNHPRRNFLVATALAATALIAGCSVDMEDGPSSTGGSGGTSGVAGAGGGADRNGALSGPADAGADAAPRARR